MMCYYLNVHFQGQRFKLLLEFYFFSKYETHQFLDQVPLCFSHLLLPVTITQRPFNL